MIGALLIGAGAVTNYFGLKWKSGTTIAGGSALLALGGAVAW